MAAFVFVSKHVVLASPNFWGLLLQLGSTFTNTLHWALFRNSSLLNEPSANWCQGFYSSAALHSLMASDGFSWFETSAALHELFRMYIFKTYQVGLSSADMEMATSESPLLCVYELTPRKHFAEDSSIFFSRWQEFMVSENIKVLFQWYWTLVNHSRLFSFC